MSTLTKEMRGGGGDSRAGEGDQQVLTSALYSRGTLCSTGRAGTVQYKQQSYLQPVKAPLPPRGDVAGRHNATGPLHARPVIKRSRGSPALRADTAVRLVPLSGLGKIFAVMLCADICREMWLNRHLNMD